MERIGINKWAGEKKIGIIPRNKNLLYIHPRIKAVPDPTPGLYQDATLNNQEIRNKNEGKS
jgi:hypothetical protein